MPVISIKRESLFTALDKEYTEEEFNDLCFSFGIELDDVVIEEGETVYKIDLPANRYDLLCMEGLTRALRVFLGQEKIPEFGLINNTPGKDICINVGRNAQRIRPFIVGAILRNVTFTQDRYDSFIALQDHLHRNICRKRTLVAIGTHDLASLNFPISYEGEPHEDISFEHLFEQEGKEMNAKDMLDFFRTDQSVKHIKEYVDIIYDSPVYPVIRDASGAVLSLTPIINGKMSKLTLDTKDVFIECAATDLTKAKIVLNMMISGFSEYSTSKFQAEPVMINYPDEPFYTKRGLHHELTPDMNTFDVDIKIDELQDTLGVSIPREDIEDLCLRMQLPAKLDDTNKNKLRVTVPITRSDILHPVDVIEDVGIAYGYNKIFESAKVPAGGSGKELPVSSLTDLLRNDLARQGYTELMSFGLCSTAENFLNLGKDKGHEHIVLGNPKTVDFQEVRLALAPGALKTLAENKSLGFSEGIKLFEVSDVVHSIEGVGVNQRNMAALYAGPSAGIENVHGTLDRVMQALGVVPTDTYAKELREEEFVQKQLRYSTNWGEYEVRPSREESFFPGMRGDVWVRKAGSATWERIGCLGAIHPKVLKQFRLTLPVSLLEMNVEVFV